MTKQSIGENVFAFVPITTQTILGTHVRGKVNFMALAWLTRVNFKPPMIAVAVNKNNQSCAGIIETGEFSLNVPASNMVAVTDYTGLVSARTTDKSSLFEVFFGRLKSAPLIRDCPLNVELKVVQRVELPTNVLFVGEVIEVHADEEILTDGAPDPNKLKPFLLSMPDTRYWSLGEVIGRAWRDGKMLKT